VEESVEKIEIIFSVGRLRSYLGRGERYGVFGVLNAGGGIHV
jgi:hypothetical protein